MDILLRGGTVIDGSGAPRALADVAIDGDRIAAVGNLADATAAEIIDVSGKIVAPGFIDVHNHSDGWLLKQPNFTSKIAQGFTTEVLASDGISYAPVDEASAREWIYYLRSLNGLTLADYTGWQSIADYLALIDGRTSQNVAYQVPYANLRVMAMGWRRDPPDDTELRRMRRLVRQGLDEGAVALSTGLDYIAQCFATTDEIAEVVAAMGPSRCPYVTHVRYKKGAVAGVTEAVEIGRRAGVPVHISHLKGGDEREADELLSYIDRVAVHEVDFTFDVYPYLPGSSMLNSLLPYEVWEGGPLAASAKLASPSVRRRFAEQLADYRLPLEKIVIAWVASKENSRFQGRSLAEFCSDVGKPPAEALADLLIEENLAVLCVFRTGDDRLAEPFVAHPRAMIGSDAIWQPDAPVHPRQYGTAPRVLGPLVRERRLLTLEDAVRKLSGFPAERFQLAGRGAVRAGAFADLVVFDPLTIADRATFAEPCQPPVGVDRVFVNGCAVLVNGQPVEGHQTRLPGRALRANAAAGGA